MWAIILALCLHSPVQAGSTLRVATSQWAPHADYPESDLPGYMVEIIKAIFEPQGHPIDYRIMPWNRALLAAKSGDIDALLCIDPYTDASLLYHKNPIGCYQDALIGPASLQWSFQGIESLTTVHLGVEDQYGIAQDFKDYAARPGNKMVHVITGEDPIETAYQMLERGRLDLIYNDISAFFWKLKKHSGDPSKYRVFHTLNKGSMYIGFYPQLPQASRYLDLVDQGIDQLRKSGELAQILSRYGVSDWVE